MESQVGYRELYEAFRDAGLVKKFETISTRFFMGIAASLTKPITGEVLFQQIDHPEEYDALAISTGTGYREFIHEVIKPNDKVRYHIVASDDFVIHYVFIYNRGLKGTIKGMEESDEAVTRMRIMVPNEELDVINMNGIRIEAIMLIGDGSPNVTDDTRGAIIKHELTHVIIKHMMEVENQLMLDALTSKPSREELDNFIEFLCDFTQFDTTVLNRYTVNPITKFSEALEFIFKPGTEDKYAPYMKAIAPFFAEQM